MVPGYLQRLGHQATQILRRPYGCHVFIKQVFVGSRAPVEVRHAVGRTDFCVIPCYTSVSITSFYLHIAVDNAQQSGSLLSSNAGTIQKWPYGRAAICAYAQRFWIISHGRRGAWSNRATV